MKNKEKFAKEIVDIACSGHSIAFDKEANKLTGCNKINCSECAFYSSSTTNCLDKIKEWSESEYEELGVDWSKVPVDTPVLVKVSKDEDWLNRYFAYYRDGKVYTHRYGATSWSADKAPACSWRYAKLANEEDISKYAK